MLDHVLERFSSSLSEEGADDLKAFSFNDTDFTCVEKSLGYLSNFAYSNDLIVKEVGSSTNEDSKIPTERECLEEIMELLHLLNDSDKGETTNLVTFLYRNMYDDNTFFEIIAGPHPS